MTTGDNTRKMGGPQWLALAAGLIVIGATVSILAGDAIATGKWGQDQWLGLVILAATIAFGLLRKRAWGEGKWASAIAFAAMFGLGTILLVYSSMGRQEAARADRAQGARNANAAIASLRSEQKRIEGDIARLKGELKRYAGARSPVEVQAALDAIVGNGPNKVPARIWRRTRSCAADETTRPDSAAACRPVFDLRIENGKAIEKARIEHDVAEKEVQRAAIVAKLQTSGGEQVVVAKAETFAELLSLIGFDKATVEHVVSRVDVLLITLFLELSAIAALEYAFAGLMVAPAQTVRVVEVPVANDDDESPVPPEGGKRRRGAPDPELGAKILVLFKDGKQPNQREVAQALGVHPSTAGRELRHLEAQGLVRRTADGKSKRIAVA